MESKLELVIVGDVPEELELEPLQRVFSLAAGAAQQLKLPYGVINLTFVDDETMRVMNREYSGNDYATDVLAFNYLESGGPIEEIIGEMVVGIETAARQAVEVKTSLSEEVALLVLHGTLHIGGYDHQNERDQAKMQRLQKDLMAEAGYSFREFKWTE